MAEPKFPWLKLASAIVRNLPPVREALKNTVAGFERDPNLLKFVEQFQTVNQKDCIICLAHSYAKLPGVPPEHWCPTRADIEKCGCGRPGVRQGQFKGIEDRKVCEDFPGCIPSQTVRR